MKEFFPLSQDGLVLEWANTESRMKQLWAFRHRIFREQLQWVPLCEDGFDRDAYDDFSDNLMLSRGGQVVGAIRLTTGDHPFMLEVEFSRLLAPGERIGKGCEYSEITRLAVDRSVLGARESIMAARLLYLGAWLWSQVRGVRWMYFVVEPVFYRRLVMMGFPIVPVGIPRPVQRLLPGRQHHEAVPLAAGGVQRLAQRPRHLGDVGRAALAAFDLDRGHAHVQQLR
ncbi:N-acyl-L-homoserine lactone synthetase [Chromobacterium vaccinii]|nr:N-acyl-L-homoserine lactone synthetase [Chromobacterium vaccinii]